MPRMHDKTEFFRTVFVDEFGRQEISQHTPVGSVHVHLHITGLTTGADFIYIDISDEVNYKHSGTTYAHIENSWIDISASNTAAYQATLGYLTDVVESAGTFVHLFTINGSKAQGNNNSLILPFFPTHARMTDEFVVTHDRISSSIYGSGSTLPSTLDPNTSNVNPNTGDVVLSVQVSSGSIDISINSGFHAH